MNFSRSIATLAIVLPLTSVAQQMQLPKDLSGRWTFVAAGRTNTFSLDEIATTQDGKFTAKLTWWTTDPACTVRNEPVAGLLTTKGITFDAKTKCNVEFTAILNAGEKEWTGQATTKGANSVVVEMKAK